MFKRFYNFLTKTAGYRDGYAAGIQAAAVKAKKLQGLLQAQCDSAKEAAKKEGYTDGYIDGRKEGVDVGKLEGVKQGTLAAYQDAVQQLGIEDNRSPGVFTSESRQVLRSVSPVQANLYWSPRKDRLTVRLIHNGERVCHWFLPSQLGSVVSVTETNLRLAALAQALATRETFSDNAGANATVYLQATDLANRHGRGNCPINIAHEYYRLRRQSEITGDYSDLEWYGECPTENRLTPTDPDLLLKPWTELFPGDVPARLRFAFNTLGLGYSGTHDPKNPVRDVRDLLLLTAADLQNVYDVGPTTVLNFQRLLATYGLALWGDVVAEIPEEERVPRRRTGTRGIRERLARGIDLGDD